MNLPVEWKPCLELAGLLALQATAVVAAAAVGQRLTRSAHWHRLLWQAAIASLVVLFALELSGLARALTASLRATTPRPGPEWRTIHRNIAGRPQTVEKLAWALPAASQSGDLALPVSALQQAEDTPPPAEPFLQSRSMPWPQLTWFLGATAALGAMLLARLVFSALFHQRSRPVPVALQERATRLAERLGLRSRVRLLRSPQLPGPVAFGVLRPTVGLPEDFPDRFSEAQQDAMLAHELAHLAARDPAWQSLADVAAALLWWHPLAWWARRCLRAAAENAADEASAVVSEGPSLLAECLVQLAAQVASRQPLGSIGATGPGFRSGLGKRIERLCRLKETAWSPLNQVRSRIMTIVMPAALVGSAVLCTAWAGPQYHGGMMNTMKTTWKRSIATVALLAASSAHPADAPAQTPAAEAGDPAATAHSAPASSIAPRPAAASPVVMSEALRKRYGLASPSPVVISEALHTRYGLASAAAETQEPQPPRNTPSAPASPPQADSPKAPAAAETAPAEDPPQADQNRYRMDPRLLERYGLRPRPGDAAMQAAPVRTNRGKQPIEAKLNQIILHEVLYDSLPLAEVIKDLQDAAQRRDPARQGLNFVITTVSEQGTTAGAGVDPTTGAPLPFQPADPGNAIIKLHLRDVRLKDVLDAMARVADPPIRYSVEEYGIVISPGPGPAYLPVPVPLAGGEPPRLHVRTFQVDTNTFLAGLSGVFGIEMPRGNEEATSARAVQHALRQALQQLGITMDVPNKAVFYNERTGIVMVRATEEDLEVVQAAIETLGGKLLRPARGSAQAVRPGQPWTVSVMGSVQRPGSLGVPAEQPIDLVEAIARAGGFSPQANQNKIELSRGGQTHTYRFSELRRMTGDAERVWLVPGDIVHVGETLF